MQIVPPSNDGARPEPWKCCFFSTARCIPATDDFTKFEKRPPPNFSGKLARCAASRCFDSGNGSTTRQADCRQQRKITDSELVGLTRPPRAFLDEYSAWTGEVRAVKARYGRRRGPFLGISWHYIMAPLTRCGDSDALADYMFFNCWRSCTRHYEWPRSEMPKGCVPGKPRDMAVRRDPDRRYENGTTPLWEADHLRRRPFERFADQADLQLGQLSAGRPRWRPRSKSGAEGCKLLQTNPRLVSFRLVENVGNLYLRTDPHPSPAPCRRC